MLMGLGLRCMLLLALRSVFRGLRATCLSIMQSKVSSSHKRNTSNEPDLPDEAVKGFGR